MSWEIRRAAWDADGDVLAAIRREVFIDEQRVAESLEWDGLDDEASHWLAFADGEPAGTLRLLPDGHIGRVAVRRPWRGRGIGRALMRTALASARATGFHEVHLNAQVDALGFYERLGFTAFGPEFDDAGIPHRVMRLTLAPRQLGRHAGRFAVSDRAAIALDLVRQSRVQLRILSSVLEPAVYDRDEFAAAVPGLARRHRNSEVRLLLLDGRQIAQRGHRLLALHRRLPSAVQIRRLELPPNEVPEAFLIADQSGLLCHDLREPESAWADYHNRPLAESYRLQFDDWWQRSSPDPELRELLL
ncbi:MAG: GNAT family N-acetyltransferase [Spongiibacteraceae bacterium]|jgi:predicted GNAT family N-acyltransferase|nr:GNAT family N-acetyltransferase [Spongiibacteraceae bacterium]